MLRTFSFFYNLIGLPLPEIITLSIKVVNQPRIWIIKLSLICRKSQDADPGLYVCKNWVLYILNSFPKGFLAMPQMQIHTPMDICVCHTHSYSSNICWDIPGNFIVEVGQFTWGKNNQTKTTITTGVTTKQFGKKYSTILCILLY